MLFKLQQSRRGAQELHRSSPVLDAGTATAVQMSPSGPHSSARTSTCRPRRQNARRLRTTGWFLAARSWAWHAAAGSGRRPAASEVPADWLGPSQIQSFGPMHGSAALSTTLVSCGEAVAQLPTSCHMSGLAGTLHIHGWIRPRTQMKRWVAVTAPGHTKRAGRTANNHACPFTAAAWSACHPLKLLLAPVACTAMQARCGLEQAAGQTHPNPRSNLTKPQIRPKQTADQTYLWNRSPV